MFARTTARTRLPERSQHSCDYSERSGERRERIRATCATCAIEFAGFERFLAGESRDSPSRSFSDCSRNDRGIRRLPRMVFQSQPIADNRGSRRKNHLFLRKVGQRFPRSSFSGDFRDFRDFRDRSPSVTKPLGIRALREQRNLILCLAIYYVDRYY